MAINYSLELETNMQPSALLKWTSQTSGMSFLDDRFLRDEVSGLTMYASLEEDEDCIKLIEDAHGYRPFVTLHIRKGKVEHVRNDILMMKIVASALKELEGDMVLEYQSGSVVIKKIGGKITFNSEWNELHGIDQLNEAGLVFDVAQIPFE